MLLRAVAAASSRRAFHAGRALPLAVHTVNVPSMGDSISEGTLVQVVKSPGDAVHADEVVAVLETDKVSVDVMSPVSGTIVEHFATLEDNVVVGAALFSVDDSRAPTAGAKSSSSSASSTSSSTPAKSKDAATKPAPDSSASSSSSSGHRTPLIQFLGKRSLLPSSQDKKAPTSSPSAPASSMQRAPSSSDVLPFHFAKKIPLSPAEVAAINSGVSYL